MATAIVCHYIMCTETDCLHARGCTEGSWKRLLSRAEADLTSNREHLGMAVQQQHIHTALVRALKKWQE